MFAVVVRGIRLMPTALLLMPTALLLTAATGLAATLGGHASEGFSTAPAGADAVIQGDADCNEAITPIDSLAVLRHDGQLANAPCADRADTNCDGSVNPVDSLRILRFDAGLPPSEIQGCASIGEPLEVPPLVLNEVLFVAGEESQFVEIRNAGGEAVNISGLTLANEDGGVYFLPAVAADLPPGGIALVLFDSGDSVEGTTVHADMTNFLTEDSGYVELLANTADLDLIAWGPAEPGAVPLGRGGIIGDLTPGTTIGRVPSGDRRGPSDWVTFSPAQATPGEPNPSPGVEVLMPVDGALFRTTTVPLTWYTIAGAVEYEVQVAAEETFAAPIVDETVVEAALTTPPLTSGEYFWRVQAIAAGDVPTGFSPVSTFTVDLSQEASRVASVDDHLLDVPLITQKKDTRMLLLESPIEDGAHAWDAPHEEYSPNDPADNTNCALAALAMINAYYGGNLSQDRIGYELASNLLVSKVEHALYYRRGTSPPEIGIGMEFAIGSSVMQLRSGSPNDDWDSVAGAIDSGVPLLAAIPFIDDPGGPARHAVVIDGYFEEEGRRYVDVNDPSLPVSYAVDFMRVNFQAFWGPDPFTDVVARSDEPSVHTDTDNDGVVDFDEVERFHTNPASSDSDSDFVPDKEEIAETAFHPQYGHAHGEGLRARYEWDGDGLHKELDCDNDNDGTGDLSDEDDYSSPPVRGSPVPCSPGDAWVGEFHSKRVFADGAGENRQERTIDAEGVVFAPLAASLCQIGQIECFETVAGVVHYTISGYLSPGCTAEGELTIPIPKGNTRLNIFPNTYTVVGNLTSPHIPVTVTCGDSVTSDDVQVNNWHDVVQYPWPDHNVIEGEFSQNSGPFGSYDSSWKIVRTSN